MEGIIDRSVHPLYAIMAFVCALIVIILIIRTRADARGQKVPYMFLFYWVAFFCIQDGIWGLFAAHILRSNAMLFITSSVFHLSCALTTIVWVAYLTSTINSGRRSRIFLTMTVVPAAIQIFMLAYNFFDNFMFYIDENGYYVSTGQRRILFYLQFAVYIAIFLYAIFRLASRRKEEETHNLFAMFCVNLSPLFMGFFQMLYPDAPADSIGFSLGCIIIFTFIAAESEQASRSKTTFLFNMSHDIRTPMNAIIGYTDKALTHIDEKDVVTDSLNKIRTSGDFLLSLISDVLDMTKIESGKVTIVEEPVCISDMNEDLTQMVLVNATSKGLIVHTEHTAVVDNYIYADKNHVNQIMLNLLSNAIKYTKPGGEIWHKVEQLPSEKAGYAKFRTTISDTGIGMSKEFLSRIYEAFERERSSTVSRVNGTGLGMSIVKKLIDLMGGTIEIESVPNKGTTIMVTLEHRITTRDKYMSVKDTSAPVPTADGSILEGKKVLLVEDNEMNREIATDILHNFHMIVESCEDGSLAVERIKTAVAGDFDLILMDIQMPIMNGHEATRAIRSLKNCPLSGIPIIAMTANAFDDDRQNALKAGMNDYITKPIDKKKMNNIISKYL